MTWWILGGIAVFASIGIVLGVLARANRRGASTDAVVREAYTIVDLLTPPTAEGPAVSTSQATSISLRLRALIESVSDLRARVVDARTVEALDDLHDVANRLGAALDADRAHRVEHVGPEHVGQSQRRIADRVAELDLAARELSTRSPDR